MESKLIRYRELIVPPASRIQDALYEAWQVRENYLDDNAPVRFVFNGHIVTIDVKVQ